MRKTCLNMVYELAKTDKRIFFIGSDLGVGTLSQFKSEMPDRFFMEGICEANIIGLAAGLAMEGKIVYVNTIASFLTRRAFEQIVLDLCLHNVKVRLIGNGGGLVYAPLGPTHMAVEDLAIMRAVPNMTIIAPADANEMQRLMPLTIEHPGPLYIRLAKGYDPVVTSNDTPFEIGRAVPIRSGQDALVVTTGITLKIALDAADSLKKEGVHIAVLHMPTIKPIDRTEILEWASMAPVIVTIEEHMVSGGLGSTVAEIIAEANFSSPKKFRRMGIPDTFPDKYGSQAGLMSHFSITQESLVLTLRDLTADSGRKHPDCCQVSDRQWVNCLTS